LFGLLVNPGTKVNYGPVNPTESREIFIRSALVQGDFNCQHDFYIHNRKLVEEIETLEAKSRRQDILVDENDVYDFYDKHLPDNMYSGPQLNKWVKKNDTSILFLKTDDLMKQDAEHVSDELFPDTLIVNSINFPLEYHFDPSHHCDGITLITPVAGLASLNANICDWLVPGMLLEKITELIRSLPKQLRKNFVPAPNFAEACVESIIPGEIPLTTSMSNHLKKMTGVDIPFDAWQLNNLPEYLFLNFRIISSDGKTLKEGRDLASLQDEFVDFADNTAISAKPHKLEQDNVDYTILDNLPAEVEVNNNGIIIKSYPTLIHDGKQVNVRIIHSKHEHELKHFEGLRLLFINSLAQAVRHLKTSIPNIHNLCIKFTSLGSCEQLKTQIIQRLIDQLFTCHLPSSSSEFTHALNSNRGNLDDELKKLTKKLGDILDIHHRLQKQLKNPPLHWLDALSDIQDQLNHLFQQDFLLKLSEDNFNNYPRYLLAIEKRLQKIQSNPERDRKARLEISGLWSDYKSRAQLLEKNNQYSPQLEAYRWLLEEYRISLFAQEIKTLVPVSAKRLKKAWNDISDA